MILKYIKRLTILFCKSHKLKFWLCAKIIKILRIILLSVQEEAQTIQNTLEPRPAIIGSVDALPLQPKYLPNFDRECRSEPRELPKSEEQLNILKSQQFPSNYFSGKNLYIIIILSKIFFYL